MDSPFVKNAQEFFKKQTKLNEKHIVSVAVVTTSFWGLQNVFQRSLGFVKLHGSKSFPVTAGLGLALTSCSLLGSHFIDIEIHKHFEKVTASYWPGLITWDAKQSVRTIRKDYVQSLLVGVSIFSIMECAAFRTTFPSSVIAPGVFASPLNTWKNSIPATGPVATASERVKVQQLGFRHGCHQCGSHQVFTRETFIADHMPPTKFANEMNNKWWRKWFKWEVSQRLWAQCRNCYSIQGGAVRSNTHVPVYHSNIRIHHFAPAVAYGLLQMDVVRHWVDKGVNPILDGMEFVEREAKKRL